MRTLVTGGAGFIGSHLVDALVAEGADVHVIDNLATGRRETSPVRRSYTSSTSETGRSRISRADCGRRSCSIFLAAQADVGTSVERPAFDAEVNVVGTVRVLEAARAAGARVVFASTGGAVYGECERLRAKATPRDPSPPMRQRSSPGRGTSNLEPPVRGK